MAPIYYAPVDYGPIRPAPISEASMDWSEAVFKARKMGTFGLTFEFAGGCPIRIHMRPLLGLCRAVIRGAAIQPTTTLIAQWLFTNPAAGEIEVVKAATGAECMMLVLDRLR